MTATPEKCHTPSMGSRVPTTVMLDRPPTLEHLGGDATFLLGTGVAFNKEKTTPERSSTSDETAEANTTAPSGQLSPAPEKKGLNPKATVWNVDAVSFEPSRPDTNADGTVVVVDPLSRKLSVPLSAITPTQAMQRSGTPSLCMLYLSNKCRQGHQCHQVHCDPALVNRLRAEAKQLPTCCLEHGDINSSLIKTVWRERILDIQGVPIAVSRCAYTTGLERVITESAGEQVIRIAAQQVCRLHVGERCRYSEDCKFIHVCRVETATKLGALVPPMIPQLELRHGNGTGQYPVAAMPQQQQMQQMQMPYGPMMVPMMQAMPQAMPAMPQAMQMPQAVAGAMPGAMPGAQPMMMMVPTTTGQYVPVAMAPGMAATAAGVPAAPAVPQPTSLPSAPVFQSVGASPANMSPAPEPIAPPAVADAIEEDEKASTTFLPSFLVAEC